MPSAVPTTRTRRLSALWIALALAAASVLLVASPAAAHDELTGSDPAVGATLDALPAQLTLTFSAEMSADAGASEVQVTDASGAALADGAPVVQGNVLTQALAGEASGAVTVLWKVVSSDGHPISGELAFTVTPASTPEPSPTSEPTETAEPEPTADPVETAVPINAPSDEDSSSGDVWPWVIGGIVVVALGGAVVYLLVSRARRQRDLDASRDGAADAARRGSEPPAAD